MKERVIVLLSGGIDSSTIAYDLNNQGYDIYPLIFDYHQRHEKEIVAAQEIAQSLKCENKIKVIKIDLTQIGGSALTSPQITVPDNTKKVQKTNVPSTYVPFRNAIFLSLAIAYAEVSGATAVYIGINYSDYEHYPDCCEPFLQTMNKLAKIGSAAGVKGRSIEIRAPLLKMNKKEIIQMGHALGVPFAKTWTCYKGEKVPCGTCEACEVRKHAFTELNLIDPLLSYHQ